MILSDKCIRSRLSSGSLVIDPEPEIIQPASVDLHLSSFLKIFLDDSVLKISGSPKMRSLHMEDWGFQLKPGQVVLGSTEERIELPTDLVARVEGKSSLGRIGLAVHITAGFVDPGFRGNITLEIKNMNYIPIKLERLTPICQLCFHETTTPCTPYGSEGLGSRYQDSVGTRAARPK